MLECEIGVLSAKLQDAAQGPQLVRLFMHDADLQSIPWEALCNPHESLGYWGSSAKVSGILAGIWHPDGTRVLLWSPDGKTIAIMMPDQHVVLWESNGSGKSINLSGNGAEIRLGAWSPDGKRFAIAGGDGHVRIWALDMPEKPIKFVGRQGSILHLAWSPDGARIATVAADATRRISNRHSGAPTASAF